MERSALLEMIASSDLGAIEELLSPDVQFRSPVADYDGRPDVVHLLTLIGRVLEDLQPVGARLEGSGEDGSLGRRRDTRFTATVGGRALQGVLCEDIGRDGRLRSIMLLLRPYRELRAAIEAMGVLLDASPLPSREVAAGDAP